jgi:hypothetical protein
MADMSEAAFIAELRSALRGVKIPANCALDIFSNDDPKRDGLAEFVFSVIGQLDECDGDKMQRLTGVVVKYNPEAYVKHLQSELGRQTIQISGLISAIGAKEAQLFDPADYAMRVSGDSKVDVEELDKLADHAVMNTGDKINTLRIVMNLRQGVIKRLETRNTQLRIDLDDAEALRELEKREKLRMANERRRNLSQQNVGGGSDATTEDESEILSVSDSTGSPPTKMRRQNAGSQHVGI